MAEAVKRLYIVPFGDENLLVRTTSKARSVRVAAAHMKIMPRLATQDDIVAEMRKGTDIIDDADPQIDLPLGDDK